MAVSLLVLLTLMVIIASIGGVYMAIDFVVSKFRPGRRGKGNRMEMILRTLKSYEIEPGKPESEVKLIENGYLSRLLEEAHREIPDFLLQLTAIGYRINGAPKESRFDKYLIGKDKAVGFSVGGSMPETIVVKEE